MMMMKWLMETEGGEKAIGIKKGRGKVYGL